MLSDIVILLLLILLNGFFTAAEAAILLANHSKVRGRAEEGNKKAVLLKKILDGPAKFLSAIQIGVSLTALFAAVFALLRFSERLNALLCAALPAISENVIFGLTVFIIVALVSYLLILFGNMLPRGITAKHWEKIAYFFVTPVRFLTVIAAPFVKITSVSAGVILRIIGIDPNLADEDVTEEEIRMLIDAGEETGSIDEIEKEMIHNVFEFDNKTVDDIATHRKDIVALPIDASRDEIVKTAMDERFSRIPVYEENIDNIIGILHLKDFLNYVFTDNRAADAEIDLRAIIRKPYFVPLTKKTDKLFEEMRSSKAHMAIVVDEYGGTAGLVTMENLIEEIMGNIYDEDDEEEMPDIEQVYENVYFVNGMADLESVSEFFGVDLPLEDYDTISGFIVGQIGHIPNAGDHTEFEFGGLIFKVHTVSEMRVSAAIVSKIEVREIEQK